MDRHSARCWSTSPRSTRANDLIHDVSEALLEAFRPRPLIDEYGVYEQLMSYWNASMHDDVALIVSEGWDDAAKPRAGAHLEGQEQQDQVRGRPHRHSAPVRTPSAGSWT